MRIVLGAVLVGGVLVRVPELVGDPNSDAYAYLELAAGRSVMDPWAASNREPLWLLIVKAGAAPFGYDPEVLQWLALITSIAAMAMAAILLSRLDLTPGARLIGVAIVAFHPLLLADVAGGVREAPVFLLSTLAVIALVESRWVAAGILVALVVGIRWELGLMWVALLTLGLVFHRVDWRALAVAVALGAVLMGPFMAANNAEYGDPLHHSNRLAMYFRNIEDAYAEGLNPFALPRFRGEPITWSEYHFSYVGTAETARRAAEGLFRLPSRVAGFGLGETVGAAVLAFALLGAVARPSPSTIGAVAFMFLVTLAYSPLWWTLALRLVSILVLPLSILLANSAHALIVRSSAPAR